MEITRRNALKLFMAGSAAMVAAPMINLGRYRIFANSPMEYSAQAIDLINRSLVIDMLSPFVLSQSKRQKLLTHPESFSEYHLQKYKDSGIDVFHSAFGIVGPDAYFDTLQYMAGWNGFIANHDEHIIRVDSVADLKRAKTSEKFGIMLGVQNSEHFREPDDIDYFFSLGQRVSQLTYNSRNMIGDGATERQDGGISDFGVSIIERMNKVGMVVDVSHCGDRTTLDAFDISIKPVLITHSNCRALVQGHPRCKTDEAIKKMAAQGGVMGITSVRMFVRNQEPTTMEHVLDHFDHVAKLVGVEHLNVGSDIDLDGYDDLSFEENTRLRQGYKNSYAFRNKIDIEGLDHPKRMYDLTEGLIRRGYSDRDIELILGKNVERALMEIWPRKN